LIGGAGHAALNAVLNGLSAICIALGWLAIRSGARDRHRRLMLTATAISALFLISYLLRFAASGTHYYPGHGAWKVLYLSLLGSHMLLAIVTPLLVLRAIWLAIGARFDEHRRIVRWAFPIWMYVSVTGVLVYVLLYHPPG
jgi:putative membrane protein